ncbi:MAG: hypothetical protein H0Z37_11285 [Firmicutes bacterium]|nr:hypothetical protein [Bacillota bacterium]
MASAHPRRETTAPRVFFDRLPFLQRVIVMDFVDFHGLRGFAAERVMRLEALEALGEAFAVQNPGARLRRSGGQGKPDLGQPADLVAGLYDERSLRPAAGKPQPAPAAEGGAP